MRKLKQLYTGSDYYLYMTLSILIVPILGGAASYYITQLDSFAIPLGFVGAGCVTCLVSIISVQSKTLVFYTTLTSVLISLLTLLIIFI
jgi:hypothetical protein